MPDSTFRKDMPLYCATVHVAPHEPQFMHSAAVGSSRTRCSYIVWSTFVRSIVELGDNEKPKFNILTI